MEKSILGFHLGEKFVDVYFDGAGYLILSHGVNENMPVYFSQLPEASDRASEMIVELLKEAS